MQSILKKMHRMLIPLLVVVVAGLITACNPDDFSQDEVKTEQQPFNANVGHGGFIFYNDNGSTDSNGNPAYEPSEDTAVSGVTVAITDIADVTQSTTSNYIGFLDCVNVLPRSYLIKLSCPWH